MISIISLASFIKVASSSYNSLNRCMAWLTLDFNSRHLPLKCPSKNEKGVFNSDEPRPPPKGFPARAGEQTLPNTPVHSSRPFRCPCHQPISLCAPKYCLKRLQGQKQAGALVFYERKTERKKELEEKNPWGQTCQRLLCSSSLAVWRKQDWSKSGNFLTSGNNSGQFSIMVLYIYIVFFNTCKMNTERFQIS